VIARIIILEFERNGNSVLANNATCDRRLSMVRMQMHKNGLT
jgi:hypothetical protein